MGRSGLDGLVTFVSSSLAGIDLNLLVVLRELLRERNVTRAAERLGVTQPAASAALSHQGFRELVTKAARAAAP